MHGMGKFLVFIAVVAAIGLFHRREHIRYEDELFLLRKELESEKPVEAEIKERLKGRDWRLTGMDRTCALLKRAFNVPGREDALRYAVPIVLFCVLIVYLGMWRMAALYGGALALKWFAAQTALDLDPFTPRYEARLFGRRLFGQSLAQRPGATRTKAGNETKAKQEDGNGKTG